MSDWLRHELGRHLGPVRAPEALWDRIQNGRLAGGLPHSHWTRWAVAAVVTMATALGTYRLPGPQLRSDVVVLAASGQPDLRRDDPTEWDLRCAPPVSRSTFRVGNVSAGHGHQFTLAVSEEGVGCQACHSMGLNQHHL
jgi:hypothetical protein